MRNFVVSTLPAEGLFQISYDTTKIIRYAEEEVINTLFETDPEVGNPLLLVLVKDHLSSRDNSPMKAI